MTVIQINIANSGKLLDRLGLQFRGITALFSPYDRACFILARTDSAASESSKIKALFSPRLILHKWIAFVNTKVAVIAEYFHTYAYWRSINAFIGH
jgi:hypothetical protein